LEIVGVVKDSDTVHLGHPEEPFLYLLPTTAEQLRLKVLVHSRMDNAAAAEAIRTAVRSIDPELTVRVSPLQQNIGVWVTPSLLGVTFASVMAGLALLIASIGIYGTVAYSVGKRTREIGIRIALGAADADILRMVLRQIIRPVVAGAAVGVVASFAASSLLTLLLFGVSRFDAAAYFSVVAFLISVALLASYLPARRALRVDPMAAIRHE
jgi:putative ABC transport system permease protein